MNVAPPTGLAPDPRQALALSLQRLERHRLAFGDRFPTVGDGRRYELADNDHWLAGFWPGLLWLAYAATGDEALRAHATSLLPSFAGRLDRGVHITHDLGFLFTLSARAQWQMAGDDDARRLALRAAEELLHRYRPLGGYIQAWGPVGDPVEGGRAIVDTLMNLPLLFWAGRQSGDPRFAEAARRHAETSLRCLLRLDGATYHTFFWDQDTGRPLGPRTHQGWADDSLWARGQAWAIYGFAVAGEWCSSPGFFSAARLAARRFLAELPAGGLRQWPYGLPTWDLRLPDDAPHHPDSSAAAIAAAGLLRLARQAGDGSGEELAAGARTLLDCLLARCLETEPEAQGLLRHGTYHALKGLGVDTYFICGDYFLLEALLLAEGRAPDFWGPGESA